VVEKPNPLAPFGDVAYATHQVHRLTHFPHAGDLILLGEIRPDGKVVTFEKQVATHGGLGGPQGHPFIAWPPGRPLAPETLNDAEHLYPYFMRHYHTHPESNIPPPSPVRSACPEPVEGHEVKWRNLS
jgi:hypothetical protein